MGTTITLEMYGEVADDVKEFDRIRIKKVSNNKILVESKINQYAVTVTYRWDKDLRRAEDKRNRAWQKFGEVDWLREVIYKTSHKNDFTT